MLIGVLGAISLGNMSEYMGVIRASERKIRAGENFWCRLIYKCILKISLLRKWCVIGVYSRNYLPRK